MYECYNNNGLKYIVFGLKKEPETEKFRPPRIYRYKILYIF